MNITTTYKTNGSGRSQILAKTSGGSPSWLDGEIRPRQRTVNFDASKSAEWNHGNAAGELILAMPAVSDYARNVPGSISHTANDSGTVHRFGL